MHRWNTNTRSLLVCVYGDKINVPFLFFQVSVVVERNGQLILFYLQLTMRLDTPSIIGMVDEYLFQKMWSIREVTLFIELVTCMQIHPNWNIVDRVQSTRLTLLKVTSKEP